MTRAPILIRVDASAKAGYERLARCQVLAAALQRRRRPTYFLSLFDPGILGMNIKRSGNEWLPADSPAGSRDDVIQMKKEILRLNPAAVIVDADVDKPYLSQVNSATGLLVSMDHLASSRFPSRMVINPLLAPGRESYEINKGTQVLLGSRFSLVRSEIRRLRPTRAQEPAPMPPNGKGNGPYRALLALGEDDPNNQILDLAKTLMTVPKVGRVDVVVRRHHPQLEEILEWASNQGGLVDVAVEPAEIAARVVRCHFALSSGSGWSLELACVGVPQLLILQNEAHWPSAQRLEEEGAATCLGWFANLSASTIAQAAQNLLTDPLERQAMARCGRKLIDGRGPDRLINALEIMLHSGIKHEKLTLAA